MRPTEAVDNGSDWKIGYGLDIAVAAKHSSTVILQQAFADIQYKKIKLGLGVKERKSEFKDKELSSGSADCSSKLQLSSVSCLMLSQLSMRLMMKL